MPRGRAQLSEERLIGLDVWRLILLVQRLPAAAAQVAPDAASPATRRERPGTMHTPPAATTATSRGSAVIVRPSPPDRPARSGVQGGTSKCRRRPSRSRSCVSHPHTTTTTYPSARSWRTTRRSRTTLCFSFATQNARFVRGSAALAQPECRCQKHPCTKIAHLFERLATSGEPGRSRFVTRKHLFAFHNRLRTTSSGAVPRVRTADMREDTSAVVEMDPRRRWTLRERIRSLLPLAAGLLPFSGRFVIVDVLRAQAGPTRVFAAKDCAA